MWKFFYVKQIALVTRFTWWNELKLHFQKHLEKWGVKDLPLNNKNMWWNVVEGLNKMMLPYGKKLVLQKMVDSVTGALKLLAFSTPHGTWLWKSIHNLWGTFSNDVHFQIGDGANTKFWTENEQGVQYLRMLFQISFS